MRTRNATGTSPRVIGRLCLYLRFLQDLGARGVGWVYSRELAWSAGVTPSQVRQDIMGIGYHGSAQHGYEVDKLAGAIHEKVGVADEARVILIGTGNLGRAILQFFQRNHPRMELVAAFDSDIFLVGSRLHGIPILGLGDLEATVRDQDIRMAILAVPESEAQKGADRLVSAGVRSILNFTPNRLHVPDGIYVEDTDIGISLVRAAFFGCCGKGVTV